MATTKKAANHPLASTQLKRLSKLILKNLLESVFYCNVTKNNKIIMTPYPPVTDYMATKLVTFHPETDIRDAIDVLLKKKISGAPVLDDQGALVGMLSEADCLRILIEGPYNHEPSSANIKVGHYMSGMVKHIESKKTILDAAYEFVHSGYKRLPVLDEEGRLVGQVSRVDILRAVQEMKPAVRHIPDSWRGREPAMPSYKQTFYGKNS
jgi:predicted transcriptional regulator